MYCDKDHLNTAVLCLFASAALLYSVFGVVIEKARGAEDDINTVAAGTLTGMLFKSASKCFCLWFISCFTFFFTVMIRLFFPDFLIERHIPVVSMNGHFHVARYDIRAHGPSLPQVKLPHCFRWRQRWDVVKRKEKQTFLTVNRQTQM